MIRIEYNGNAFISCLIGLDHFGSKLHICRDSVVVVFAVLVSRLLKEIAAKAGGGLGCAFWYTAHPSPLL